MADEMLWNTPNMDLFMLCQSLIFLLEQDDETLDSCMLVCDFYREIHFF